MCLSLGYTPAVMDDGWFQDTNHQHFERSCCYVGCCYMLPDALILLFPFLLFFYSFGAVFSCPCFFSDRSSSSSSSSSSFLVVIIRQPNGGVISLGQPKRKSISSCQRLTSPSRIGSDTHNNPAAAGPQTAGMITRHNSTTSVYM